MSEELEKEAVMKRSKEEDFDTAKWFENKGGHTGQLARAYLALKDEISRLKEDKEKFTHEYNEMWKLMDRVIGTCSKCGGKVTIPGAWYGLFPPEPTCILCGRRKKSTLPVIEMEENTPAMQPGMDMIKELEKK